MNAIIEDVYEKNNYPGRDRLIKLVKKDNPGITTGSIKRWYDNQLDVQLLHKQQKQGKTGHITPIVENEILNIDIFD